MFFTGRTPARVFAIAILSATGLGCSAKETNTAERGKVLYGYCNQCHQSAGQGSQLAQAPNIAGLESWYVEGQLVKFRDGIRGAHPDDVEGLKMRPMARTVAATADLQAVAAYVASLPPAPAEPTLEADPERGRALFQTSCVSCHGDKAQGNKALGAPALAGRDDWYLVRQLEKFRSGVRGGNPADVTGGQMRAMALTIPDDRAVRDVAAYLTSIRQ